MKVKKKKTIVKVPVHRGPSTKAEGIVSLQVRIPVGAYRALVADADQNLRSATQQASFVLACRYGEPKP